jgi:hypothetical protein
LCTPGQKGGHRDVNLMCNFKDFQVQTCMHDFDSCRSKHTCGSHLPRLVPTDPDASGLEHGSRLIECAHVLTQVCLAAATTRHNWNKGYQLQELSQPVSFGWEQVAACELFSRTYVNELTAKSSKQDACVKLFRGVKQTTTKWSEPQLAPRCCTTPLFTPPCRPILPLHHGYVALLLPWRTMTCCDSRAWAPRSHLRYVNTYRHLRQLLMRCLSTLSDIYCRHWNGSNIGSAAINKTHLQFELLLSSGMELFRRMVNTNEWTTPTSSELHTIQHVCGYHNMPCMQFSNILRILCNPSVDFGKCLRELSVTLTLTRVT